MAVEPERGCGYRKAGGIYLVGGGEGEPCERLPIELSKCPCCGHAAFEQNRGFEWITVDFIQKVARPDAFNPAHCTRCPICQPVLMDQHGVEPADKFGLMWVGEKFYPTPADWLNEMRKLGISKRVPAVPKGFVPGKTYVLVAHPKVIQKREVKPRKPDELHAVEEAAYAPGIFYGFRARLEVVVTESMKKDGWVKALVEKYDAKLVEVPEDDPDHAAAEPRKSDRKRAMELAAEKAKYLMNEKAIRA